MSETLRHAVLGTEQNPIWFLMIDQLNPFYKVQVFLLGALSCEAGGMRRLWKSNQQVNYLFL